MGNLYMYSDNQSYQNQPHHQRRMLLMILGLDYTTFLMRNKIIPWKPHPFW